MEKERKLTLKQRKFLKYYLETGNASEASRRAGYANDRQQGCQNLTKFNIRQAFMMLLDKKGLTDEKIVDKIMELIEAKKPISANITYGDADEKTTDFIDVPDNPTQIKAIELLMKVKSLIGGDKTIIDRSSHQTNVLLQLRKMYEEKEDDRQGNVIDVTPEVSQ